MQRRVFLGAGLGALALGAPPKKSAAPQTAKAEPAKAPPAVGAPQRTFGPASAPVVIEIFSDFQCPACRNLHNETLGQIEKDYVKTGKVQLHYHEFPLTIHSYARKAARYAVAASLLGHYKEVGNILFATQEQWPANGQIEQALHQNGLKPELVDRIKDMLSDPRVDQTIADDMLLAQKVPVQSTPTMLIKAKGKSYTIAGIVKPAILGKFIDEQLK